MMVDNWPGKEEAGDISHAQLRVAIIGQKRGKRTAEAMPERQIQDRVWRRREPIIDAGQIKWRSYFWQ